MLPRLAKLCVLILLVISIGGQWALPQSVAWAGMLVEYSHDGGVTAAFCKTFDGKHPCPLCRAIAASKRSEQKKEISLKLQKLVFPPSARNWALISPAAIRFFSPENLGANGASPQPPTPPPRLLPS